MRNNEVIAAAEESVKLTSAKVRSALRDISSFELAEKTGLPRPYLLEIKNAENLGRFSAIHLEGIRRKFDIPAEDFYA